MEHVRIFSAVINLILGTWLVFYIYQKNKSLSYPFLKYLYHYVIYYNLCIVIILLGKYFELNLMESISPGSISILKDMAVLCAILFGYGMIISILRIAFGIRDQTVPLRYKIWTSTGLAVLILHYCTKFIFLSQDPSPPWLSIIQVFAIANVFILDMTIPIDLIKYKKRCEDQDKGTLSKALGYFYLSRYGVAIFIFLTLGFIFWWNTPDTIQPFVAFVILIYINLIPLLWLKYFFLPYTESLLKIVEDKAVLEPVFEKYHISKREQEILKLILNGKSNREIEDTLFISYHTVKNHVYNLYQKLGVKTRYELVHFFTKYQNDI